MKLNILPRVKLASLPTPLQELPNLSRALKGPRIYVKRDDMTGLGFGGNKTRKLEYILGEVISQKGNAIVTGAGFQSNWCTQTAAAACRLGMKVILVKRGPRDGYDAEEYDGNDLVHRLMGAEIRVAGPENWQRVQDETVEELKAEGYRPYLLEKAGSTPPGVAGYVNCIRELMSQAFELEIDLNYLVHATGGGGTQAGLIIGAKAFNTNLKVIGSTTGFRPIDEVLKNVSDLIDESLDFLDLDLKISGDDIVAYDEYARAGYGVLNEGKVEAIKLVAETEGLYLDPVYTSSGMACLIDLCRKGFFKPDDTVVFLHTGGSAALFPYKTPLKDYLLGRALSWTIPPWSPLAI